MLTQPRLDSFAEAGKTPLPPGLAVVRWLACDAAPDHWLDALDATERARVARFHFAADRASFVAAHALTRAMLARYGGLPAAQWRFTTGEFGKPSVDPALDRSWLRFNMSHTRGMAACMVMRDTDVGVDVETLDRERDVLGLAERYFLPEETALIDGADAKAEMFLRLWIMKESVMKATGQGFNLALDALAITLDPPGVRFVAGPRGAWSFCQRPAGSRHVLAAAARQGAVRFDAAAARI